jgi:cobalamin biosynthesis Mg chelatase CobN
MVRDDLRQLAEEAARRERRAWLYVSLVAVLIVVVAFGFIWLTW